MAVEFGCPVYFHRYRCREHRSETGTTVEVEIIRGVNGLLPKHRGSVVSVGNFDGIHLGHQAVLAQLARIGVERQLPTTLITFEPHPREFFSAQHAPPRLTRLREKVVELAKSELDRVVVLRFDESLSSMAPSAFIERILVDRLGSEMVVMGEDFRFGHRAEGNIDLMREAGEVHGFDVRCHETYLLDGHRVSSSWVRDALAHGDFAMARRLLGRPYTMCGRVSHGNRIGRTLGYATANISLRRVAPPMHGVFAVRLLGVGGHALSGMASIGHRPTVGGRVTLLEVHVFDFSRDIYGRMVTVEFVSKLRDEECYDGLDTLRRQMDRDADAARAVLREA